MNELSTYLGYCEAMKAPVVLDMRENGGGDLLFADMFYRLFETPSTPKSYTARALPLVSGNYAYIDAATDKMDSTPTLLRSLIFTSANNGLKRNQSITDWTVTRPKDKVQATFTGPMVLTVSENCVSACEATTNRFKVTGRAKITGRTTSGTGFGFSSNGTAKTSFRDTLNLIEISLPNQAFQTAIVADDSQFQSDDDWTGSVWDFSKINLLENHPVAIDLEISYTLNDMRNTFVDYKQALANLLAELK
jgi:hypothetical protein